ncbi:MAG: aspartate aminotransferase family protein [Chloroflexota bacterium]|nr:aspartate aminotransferase family protein [Chloroflexota bacterium]
MVQWQELEQKYLMQTVNRLPVTLVKGDGIRVWDYDGKEYLDFVGGWAVNTLGHCHPVVVQAITKQAGMLIQTSNQFYTIPQVCLAELLVKNSCFNRVFFSNSGTEANEGAVKLARKYGKAHLNNAHEVITMFNSFHGRTLAMVAATGQEKYQHPYIPLPDGFANVEYDNVAALKEATTSQTCAVMLETVQGEGGVIIPNKSYIKEVRHWCDQKGILLILDEIQTGIARVGTLFSYQRCGVEPDIMTLAKGLGGGIPIGAILAKEKVAVFGPGDHGTTFGGNPLACATSLAVMKYVIEEALPDRVQEVGTHFLGRLEGLRVKLKCITEVRGQGLLIALQFNEDIANKVMLSCLEKGLLINCVKPNVLRFMPPLTVTRDEIDQAIVILGEAITAVTEDS